MTNSKKIKKAEATKLLNEVKSTHDNEEDVIAKYKEDYCKGREYYLNSQSKVDFISVGDSFEKVELFSLSPYQHYLTEELAEQAKELKDFNDKLLAFKYCYDKDFVPDWNNGDTEKWSVYFDATNNRYCYTASYNCYYPNVVYFSCEIVAKECCKWLNSLERRMSHE